MYRSVVIVVLLLLSPFTCLADDRFARNEERLPFNTPPSVSELPETALFDTTKGAFEIRLFREQSPVSVRNFQYLVEHSYYNNTSFYRHVPGYVLQGGDPLGTGKGGPGYNLPPEFSGIKHLRGTIGMARYANPVNPSRRSHGSQFYICLTRAKHLDGLYTVFGEIINGMDVVDKLTIDDRILNVRFTKEFTGKTPAQIKDNSSPVLSRFAEKISLN